MNLKIDITGIKENIDYLTKIKNIYKDKEFISFLKNKALVTVKYITDTRLTSLVDLESALFSKYRNSHKIKDTTTGFILYNDLSREWTEYNFSIAEAVEYGIGIVGKNNRAYGASENFYEYDVNNHGNYGWVYKDDSGNTHWTKGYEGRNVYYYTYIEIIKNMENWVNEFIEKEL